MDIISELASMPGVIAAGEYSYRGDRFSYQGHLDNEQARMASIMCRATTMSVHMQAEILESFCEDCGLTPSRGWMVSGPGMTVCVYTNVFAFIDNSQASKNDVMAFLSEKLADNTDDLV